jgi:hypothetical protein
VLSVVACVRREYCVGRNTVAANRPLPSTHDEAIERGWEYQGERLDYWPICADQDWGDALRLVDDDVFDMLGNSEWAVVACWWPPEEDRDRLAGVAERLMADARERVEKENQEKAKEVAGKKPAAKKAEK